MKHNTKMQEEKITELLDKAASFEAAGQYDEAIGLAEKAVESSVGMEYLHWTARYYYHIFRILYDKTIHFNREYRELIELREEVCHSDTLEQRMYSEEGVDIGYLKLLHFLAVLRFGEYGSIPEYEAVTGNYQRVVEFYGITEHGGIDHFTFSNLCLADFYTSKGNHLAAIQYYEKILDKVEMDSDIHALTFQSLTNLSFAYINHGETGKAKKLCKFLYDGYHKRKLIEPLQEDLQRLVLAYSNACGLDGAYGRAVDIILESIQNEMIFHVAEDDYMWVIYDALLDYYSSVGTEQLNSDMINEMLRVVDEKERTDQVEKMKASDRAEFYHAKALLFEQMNEEDNAVHSMEQAVSEYLGRVVGAEERMYYANFMTIALEFFSFHQKEWAEKCARHILEQLPRMYSGAEYLLDNVQMEEYLAACNRIFALAYSFYSSESAMPEQLFTYSANYKNILLSIVRGRTKKIYHDEYNLSRVEKINKIRDKLASGKNRKKRLSGEEVMELSEELKELEMEFASFHDRNEEIPFFSLERIMTVLPKDTALIEMIYTEHDAWKTGRTEALTGTRIGRKKSLDLFLLVKDKTVTFKHVCIKETEELTEKIQIFNEKIISPNAKHRKEANFICEAMFGGFREYLGNVSTVLLSPHEELYNVPFETVFQESWEEFSEKSFVYCQSVRDLFENDYGVNENSKESCVIGNPQYNLTLEDVAAAFEGKEKNPDNRGISGESVERLFDIENIKSLPYSGYEAGKVAELVGCSAYTGSDATKYQIGSGFSVLHFATHGIVRQIGDRNAWYNSSLAFAGIADWYVSGAETERYGNGLLTAEEISRMDLRTVNLVVLSACDSGKSSFTIYEQQSGLHLAFGVAGAKYVLSSLWKVDDLATSIFMILFYQSLTKFGNVAEAMEAAKKKIRVISVGEIKKMVEQDKKLISEKLYTKLVAYLAELLDDTILYRSQYYYASFVCYQYRF